MADETSRSQGRQAEKPEGSQSSQSRRGRVTPADRAHFAVIAEVERQNELDRIDDALCTPPGERILMGLRLGRRGPRTPAHLAEDDARADGQMELRRRALARGIR